MNQDLELLLQRNEFLEKKNEQLRQDNNKLKMELSQYKDELDISKKLLETLNEKLRHMQAFYENIEKSPDKEYPLKKISSCGNSPNKTGSISSKNDSDEHQQDYEIRIEPFYTNFNNALNQNHHNENNSDLKSIKLNNNYSEFGENFLKTIENKGINDLKGIAESVNSDKSVFYKYNDILLYTYEQDNPILRNTLLTIEKKYDTSRLILKKWCNKLKEISIAELSNIKSLEIFSNELLYDKEFFKMNKELYNLIFLLQLFLKELIVYKEILHKTILQTIYTPLRNFYKHNIHIIKDSRKKLNKIQEDFELAQIKFLSLKKHIVNKDHLCFQDAFKAYLISCKNYELCRIEHIQNINSINMNINIQIVDKICTFFAAQLAYHNVIGEIVNHLEDHIDTYAVGISRKFLYLKDMINNIKNYKENIIQTYSLEHMLSKNINAQLEPIIKEGYLFIRNDKKEFQKKYVMIKDDGFMYAYQKNDNNDHTLKQLVNLKFSTVRETNEYDLLYCFELMCALNKKPIIFQVDTPNNMYRWINAIKNITENLLFRSDIKKHENKDRSPQMKPKNSINEDIKLIYNENDLTFDNMDVNSIIINNKCIDCGAEKPSWISLNLCAIICLECSGIHRSLGSNISKVRSLKFDNLNSAIIGIYTQMNWEACNNIWEDNISHFQGQKPKSNSNQIDKEKWIKAKYIEKLYIAPLIGKKSKQLKIHVQLFTHHLIFGIGNITNTLLEAIKNNDLRKVIHCIVFNKVDLTQPMTYEGKKRYIIHIACMYSKKYIIEFLLQNGSKLDSLDQDSCNPLDAAMLANNIEAIEYLLKRIDDLEC